MTQAVPASMVAGNADLVKRYEELRRQVLSPDSRCSAGQGLALFLRQGMKGWLDAWLRCWTTGPTKALVKSSVVEGVAPCELRGDLRTEIVALLASMALSVGQEVRA